MGMGKGTGGVKSNAMVMFVVRFMVKLTVWISVTHSRTHKY